LLSAVLIGGYGIPADIVFGRMFPGTAIGVLVGISSIHGWRFGWRAAPAARMSPPCRSGSIRRRPSDGAAGAGSGLRQISRGGFGSDRRRARDMVFGNGGDHHHGRAENDLGFRSRTVRRLVPQAGLLGSLAGIALMLIGFLPLVEYCSFRSLAF